MAPLPVPLCDAISPRLNPSIPSYSYWCLRTMKGGIVSLSGPSDSCNVLAIKVIVGTLHCLTKRFLYILLCIGGITNSGYDLRVAFLIIY